ncbi:MAG TPA: sodium/pantothenate symporter [Candidatus Desulfovibrio intestinipullorum]|uniref:Sodium/pantothenate symporter n=1 Tax=Candidatus Desulfovibrio intestinipullorum TaxID=2838536 RepID=A0A9D1PWU7_9BACT|nr:sodium/pantothenate symporter [Candidatus Desulfovibrio intestinipullorum]
MSSLAVLAPVLLFMAVMLLVSAVLSRAQGHASQKGSSHFLSEYFIGSRSLGGFVLAMTTVATYSSVSSFVGGPGQAWEIGFGWIYMSVVQVTMLILLLGVLGKKLALAARQINAVTIIDIIRHRYQSDLLATLSAVIIVIFLCATMIAQFVGGAKLFEAVTGLPYLAGLALFGLSVVVYTTVGGFRGVAVTDAVCAVFMLAGMVVLLAGLLQQGGGFAAIMTDLASRKPELLEPLSAGQMPVSLYISQWVLVGLCVLALPQSAVRCLSYESTRSLHRALVIGTVVIGAMNIGMNLIGVLSAGVLTDDLAAYGGSIDNIIPRLIASMSPLVAGFCIIGPIAATISTISSLLLAASSSLVKDIYLYELGRRGLPVSGRRVTFLSQGCTLVLGLASFMLSIDPPSVIWKINMFAFGGLESAFLWIFLLGLFWKKANRTGGLAAICGGTLSYCLAMLWGIRPAGLHPIVIGIAVSLICFLAGSRLGQSVSPAVLKCYFASAWEDGDREAGKTTGTARPDRQGQA